MMMMMLMMMNAACNTPFLPISSFPFDGRAHLKGVITHLDVRVAGARELSRWQTVSSYNTNSECGGLL